MMAARAVIETTLADLESTCLPLTDRAIDKHWVDEGGFEPPTTGLRVRSFTPQLLVYREH